MRYFLKDAPVFNILLKNTVEMAFSGLWNVEKGVETVENYTDFSGFAPCWKFFLSEKSYRLMRKSEKYAEIFNYKYEVNVNESAFVFRALRKAHSSAVWANN